MVGDESNEVSYVKYKIVLSKRRVQHLESYSFYA